MRSRRSKRLVHFVVRRRDAVDAGSTILAGQLVGLHHPIQIDDVVERAERRPPFRPRQIGYPLSVRGQVCGVQCPLPCVRSTVLSSWRLLPSAGSRPARFPVLTSTMKALRLPARACLVPYGFGRRPHVFLLSFVLAEALLASVEDCSLGLEHLVSRPFHAPGMLHPWARAGSHRFPGDPYMPLPCSKTPAEPSRPRL
jgi:hypothetical protein